jgi:hypothetical protein
MNRLAIVALANRYASLLDGVGAVAQRADLERRFDRGEDRSTLLNHARWQVEMVTRVIDLVGGEPTAIRLLGSAQGLLIATGLLTVGEVWLNNQEWLDGASNRAFDSAVEEMGG